ncbi:hypothetical protein D8S78_09695 [Natrialba swarupiae]|nr:hypothetical protein [Natrialba swarupiae]
MDQTARTARGERIGEPFELVSLFDVVRDGDPPAGTHTCETAIAEDFVHAGRTTPDEITRWRVAADREYKYARNDAGRNTCTTGRPTPGSRAPIPIDSSRMGSHSQAGPTVRLRAVRRGRRRVGDRSRDRRGRRSPVEGSRLHVTSESRISGTCDGGTIER